MARAARHRRGYRPLLVSVVAALLLGALINVIVLWCIQPLTTGRRLPSVQLQNPDAIWANRQSAVTNVSGYDAVRASEFGYTVTFWWVWGELTPAKYEQVIPAEYEYLAVVELGWPMRCTREVINRHDRNSQHWRTRPQAGLGLAPSPWWPRTVSYVDDGLIPLDPLPGPFLVNSIFYAAILLAIRYLFAGGITIARRKGPGRCPRCGYDLRHQETSGCPECGWRR